MTLMTCSVIVAGWNGGSQDAKLILPTHAYTLQGRVVCGKQRIPRQFCSHYVDACSMPSLPRRHKRSVGVGISHSIPSATERQQISGAVQKTFNDSWQTADGAFMTSMPDCPPTHPCDLMEVNNMVAAVIWWQRYVDDRRTVVEASARPNNNGDGRQDKSGRGGQ